MKQIRARDVAGARTSAATLAPFWERAIGATQRSAVLTKTLRVARGLDDPNLAMALLAPFQVEALVRSGAAPAASLVSRDGYEWAEDLVARWFNRRPAWPAPHETRRVWIESLAPVITALASVSADGAGLVHHVLAGSWAWLRDQVGLRAAGSMPSRQALDRRVRLESGLDSLAQHAATRLTARVARPVRAADDWSVMPPGGCGCELCAMLARLLTDPARQSYDWPLAKPGRRHVHSVIDQAELPVHHETRRQGRPYTFVLTKTDALFDRERQQCQQDIVDLAWLQANYPVGRAKTTRTSRRTASDGALATGRR